MVFAGVYTSVRLAITALMVWWALLGMGHICGSGAHLRDPFVSASLSSLSNILFVCYFCYQSCGWWVANAFSQFATQSQPTSLPYSPWVHSTASSRHHLVLVSPLHSRCKDSSICGLLAQIRLGLVQRISCLKLAPIKGRAVANDDLG